MPRERQPTSEQQPAKLRVKKKIMWIHDADSDAVVRVCDIVMEFGVR